MVEMQCRKAAISKDEIAVASTMATRSNAHQVTYGDWCGPGGSGPDIWGMDGASHVHDVCLDNLKLTWGDETKKLPGDLGSKLQACNQTLCDSATKVGGVGGWTIGTFFNHYGNYTCH
jgi:hypothetical protein